MIPLSVAVVADNKLCIANEYTSIQRICGGIYFSSKYIMAFVFFTLRSVYTVPDYYK